MSEVAVVVPRHVGGHPAAVQAGQGLHARTEAQDRFSGGEEALDQQPLDLRTVGGGRRIGRADIPARRNAEPATTGQQAIEAVRKPDTLPGLTKASLYPKALGVQGIAFADFLAGQIALAERRAAR